MLLVLAGYKVHYSGDTFVITNVHTPEPTEPGVILYLNKVLRDDNGNLVDDGKPFTVKIVDKDRNEVAVVEVKANQEPVIVRGLKWGEVYSIGEVSGSYYNFKGFHVEGVTMNGVELLDFETLTFQVTIPEGHDPETSAGRIFITLNNEKDDIERPPTDPNWPDDPIIIEIPPDLVPLAPGTTPEAPGTGDYSVVPFAAFAAAGAGILVLAVTARKRKKKT